MPLSPVRPWIIGHRGVPYEAPENTLKSFELAINQGADLLEIDLHLSADNQLVVIHDDFVDRTTNGSGRVNQLTLKELKTLDAGCWMSPMYCGERIPTLYEVLDLSADRAGIVVELKHGSDRYAGIEHLLVRAIEISQRLDDVIVMSSNSAVIHTINAINLDVMTMDFGHLPIASPKLATCKRLQKQDKRFMFAKPSDVDAECIKRLHDLGFRVLSSVINGELSQSLVEKLLISSVDGIFTDHVLKLKRRLKRC